MQSDIYKHLLGTELIDTSDYTNVVGVRKGDVESQKLSGYEIIKEEELSDIVLMGIPKAQQGGAQ